MIVEAAEILSAAVLLAAGIVVWALLKWVKTFGDYAVQQEKVTTLLLAVHESNQLLAGQNARMLEALKRAKSNGHQQGAA